MRLKPSRIRLLQIKPLLQRRRKAPKAAAGKAAAKAAAKASSEFRVYSSPKHDKPTKIALSEPLPASTAKAAAAEMAVKKAEVNTAAEKATAERAAATMAAEAAAASPVALERPPSPPAAVTSLADAQFDTGRL